MVFFRALHLSLMHVAGADRPYQPPRRRSPVSPSEREQGFEPGSNFVKHPRRRFAYEARSPLLPRSASQLIGLDNATDFLTLRQCDVKAPIAIPSRYRTGNAATGQLVKGARRKNKRGPPSGLLVGNGLQEIQPNNVAGIGAVGRHLTMPHCRAWNPNRPLWERRLLSFRPAIHRVCSSVCGPV